MLVERTITCAAAHIAGVERVQRLNQGRDVASGLSGRQAEHILAGHHLRYRVGELAHHAKLIERRDRQARRGVVAVDVGILLKVGHIGRVDAEDVGLAAGGESDGLGDLAALHHPQLTIGGSEAFGEQGTYLLIS